MKGKGFSKFKHLSWNDRLVIERMLNRGYSKNQIADAVGCSRRTIYYEIKRCTYEHTNSDLTTELRYNPEGAERRYREFLSKKGRPPKLKRDSQQNKYIHDLIVDQKYSPQACLLEISKNNLSFDTEIKSVNTIYRSIRHGIIENVSMGHLPRLGKKPKKRVFVMQKRASAGTSIEKRGDEVDARATFGHWEMDCVIGKSTNRKTLLVLTERKTRTEIIEILKHKNTAEVVRALNRIEKRYKSSFYKVFRSITVDNGSEFYDVQGMEKALNRKGKRTTVFYCHAHAPQERGSNEVQNLLIRRWLPKGSDFDRILNRTMVKDLEWWINTYPRPMFNGENSLERFTKELQTIGCRILPE